MILFLIICSILFFIYVFFYKQSISDYTILQLDYSQIQKISETLLEKSPVIIKNIEIPHCIQKRSLLNVQRFADIFVGSCKLSEYLNKNKCILQISKELETFIANETGFQSYINSNWLEKLHTHPLSSYISSIESKLCFGSHQLQKTSAIYTLIMPIEPKYTISIINPNYISSLPEDWRTIQDLESSNLKFIDVIVRPDTLLILPPHWFYLMKAEENGGYYSFIEYHEPVSSLNRYLEKKLS
jgi:hypothetical protein